MNELSLPPDTPILYEEGLWELCTDRAYEMMEIEGNLLMMRYFTIISSTGQLKFIKQTYT